MGTGEFVSILFSQATVELHDKVSKVDNNMNGKNTMTSLQEEMLTT